jgi:small-conductance mechanosensitive channel
MNTPAIVGKLTILSTHVAGQTMLAWILFFAIWILVFAALRVPKQLIARRVEALSVSTGRDFWKLVAQLVRRTSPIFLLTVSFYVASSALKVSPKTAWEINVALIIAFIFQAALWMDQAATYAITELVRARLGEDASITSTVDVFRFFARLAVWSIALLLALSNLQVNVTTLIAGLGVGGIAIALAVNQILGDFFASMAILLDKPFDVGHFIVFDNFAGTVEHIGFKTTRLRSITGEQLIVGNAGLLASRIRNFRRLQERRVLFILAVKDEISEEKLVTIPAMLKEIVGKVPKTRFERAHLKEYVSPSINYEVVYWVEDRELHAQLDVQQQISLELLKRFKQGSIPISGITVPPM